MSARLSKIEPGPGQESVWDYPRPPRVEDTGRHVEVLFNGAVIANSRRVKRALETSHAPVYYLPPDAAWTYFDPLPDFEPIRSHVAVFPHAMDTCLVDGERFFPQPGAFYGSWVTVDVVGPFRGRSGSWGW